MTPSAALVALAVYGFGFSSALAQDARPPSREQVVSRLGHGEEDRQALMAGTIVTADVERTRADQLIAAAAVRLPADIKTLLAKARVGKNLTKDPAIPAAASIDPGPRPGRLWAHLATTSISGGHAATLVAGYRALSQDFNDGDGGRRFKWDLILHGPLLGLGIQF